MTEVVVVAVFAQGGQISTLPEGVRKVEGADEERDEACLVVDGHLSALVVETTVSVLIIEPRATHHGPNNNLRYHCTT
jgi:hypothetical protein